MSLQQASLDTLFAGLPAGVDLDGAPGPMTIFGPRAFPILAGKSDHDGSRQAIGAAAYFGEGRVVGFGHDTFTRPKSELQNQLLLNCVLWTSAGSGKAPGALSVGIIGFNQYLKNWAPDSVFKISEIDAESLRDGKELNGFDAVIVGDVHLVTQVVADALKYFIKRGGGLVVAGTGWPNKDNILTFGANLICQDAGFGWTGEYGVTPINSDKWKPDHDLLENIHAGKAWNLLVSIGGHVIDSTLEAQLKSSYFLAKNYLPSGHPLVLAISENRGVRYNDDDMKELLKGLEDGVEKSGTVGMMSVYGPYAFVILPGQVDTERQAVGGATRFGNGRITAFGHTSFTNPSLPTTSRLMTNCINWTGGKKNGEEKLRVGILKRYWIEDWLTQNAGIFDFEYFGSSEEVTEMLGDIDTLVVTDVDALWDSEHIKLVRQFIVNGGGLVISATAWAVKTNLKTDFSGNLLLQDTGIAWNGGYEPMPIESDKIGYTARAEYLADTNASICWELLLWHLTNKIRLPEDRLNQIAAILSVAADSVANTGPASFPAKLKFELEEAEIKESIPSEHHAISDTLEKFKIKMMVNYVYNAEDAPGSTDHVCHCHPAACYFPGLPSSEAVRVQGHPVRIETTTEQWYSTGLYAPPGEEISVKFSQAPYKKFVIQIGTHQDDISKTPEWQRCPVILVRKDLRTGGTELQIRNAFGGLIYLHQTDTGKKLELVDLTISGAILAPYFVLGKTTLDEWRQIKNYGTLCPWGELETKKLILTVPGSRLAELENPIELMEFWDQVMDAQADLAAIPRNRPYPERLCADVQISAGYMHSGYPIMILTDKSVATALSVAELKGEEGWGFYHEIGHNHQVNTWTFYLVTEITNNMFALYVYEEVVGITPAKARPDKFEPSNIRSAIEACAERGADYEYWANDPWLGLLFYYQLKVKYGWDTYKKVFKNYQTLEPKPDSEQDKVDTWLVQFSLAAGENLTPMFKAWGIPVRDEAVAKVNHLPPTDQTLFSLIHN